MSRTLAACGLSSLFVQPLRPVLFFPLVWALGCTPAPAEDPQSQLKAWNVELSEEAFLGRAQVGDATPVRLMLEAGMDPNVAGARGETALRYAAANGKPEVVRLLLEAGADVNVEDADGLTPLRYAAYYGHKDVVETLLENGADLDGGSRDGWTAEAVALGRGHADIVRILRDARS